MPQSIQQITTPHILIPEASHGMRPEIDMDQLREAVSSDLGLNPQQREEVLKALREPSFLAQLGSGALGASLSYLLAKYLKMNKATRIVLSIAGFGVGVLLYNYKTKPDKFVKYDRQLKMYELRD